MQHARHDDGGGARCVQAAGSLDAGWAVGLLGASLGGGRAVEGAGRGRRGGGGESQGTALAAGPGMEMGADVEGGPAYEKLSMARA